MLRLPPCRTRTPSAGRTDAEGGTDSVSTAVVPAAAYILFPLFAVAVVLPLRGLTVLQSGARVEERPSSLDRVLLLLSLAKTRKKFAHVRQRQVQVNAMVGRDDMKAGERT